VVLFSVEFNKFLPLIVERLLKCGQFNVFLKGHDELGIGFCPELLASPVKSTMRIPFKERKLVGQKQVVHRAWEIQSAFRDKTDLGIEVLGHVREVPWTQSYYSGGAFSSHR
jgi:hypothetical protein